MLGLVLLSGCAGTRPVGPQNGGSVDGQSALDGKIAELAASLLPDPGTDRKLKIVIIPLSDLECRVSEFGKYVSEGLIANLAKTGRYSIVERELLYKILEEQKLGMLGIIDDASATKVGKILGVDCIVTGTFSALDARVKINARLIATETGLILRAGETNIAKNKEVELLLQQAGQAVAVPVSGTPGRWAKTEVHVPSSIPSPAYGKDYYAEQNARMRTDAVPVTISIHDGRFVPVIFGVAANWNECPIHLVSEKPKAVRREPLYQGSNRKYGFIRLGNTDTNIFYFALDLITGPHPLLYLDKNQNGDLTDDGGPIMNQGDKAGVFSAEITLPFDRILKGADFPEDYKAWLFTNETYWQRDVMCVYSKSQLKGKVVLDGTEYLTYLVDAGANDANFTSKGVYLDVNRNGKIDDRSEFFEPEAVAEIWNKRYEFKVTW
jgi:TolB-like protein